MKRHARPAISISHRLFLIILFSSGLGLFLSCAGFIAFEMGRQREIIAMRLETLAAAVGSNTAAALLFADEDEATKTLAAFSADEHIRSAGLYDATGRLFAVYARPGVDARSELPGDPMPLGTPPRYIGEAVALQRPVMLDNEVVGTIHLRADLGEMSERIRNYAVIVLAVLAASAAVAVLVGLWLQKSITRPILALTHAVRGMGEGRPWTPLPVTGNDETSILTAAFNTMVENLQRTTVSKNYVDNVFRSMFDMLIVAAADGRIEAVNRAACELLGYKEEELVGRSLNAVLQTDSLDETGKLSMAPGTGWPEERVYVARDGRNIPVSFTIAAMPGPNDSIGYVCVAQDITQRKRQEEVIREQQAQLASVSRMSALGEMAAGVAHEINNPLAIIQGRAGQLKILAKREQLDLDAVLAIATRIEETVMRGIKIINAMRLFAREGRHEPCRIVTVRSLIDETLELCRERFRYHDVALDIGEIPPEVTIECRAPQIGQVLLNLLNNAFDAVAKHDPRTVSVRFRARDNLIVLSVSNSGEPISDEIREKIFEPFFSTKEVGKGTGLGLSISKGIAESHGGDLFLSSAATPITFDLVLPRRQAANRRDAEAAAPAQPPGPARLAATTK
jgi:PAS domain S-box-containing protein